MIPLFLPPISTHTGTVQIPYIADIAINSPACVFNGIRANDSGEPDALRIDMFDHAQFETPARELIGKFFAASRNPLLLACIFVGLSTCASAQVLGGSLGRQAAAGGYASLNSAAAAISLSAVLPASVGVSVSNVPLVITVKDSHKATDVIRVPVTIFWHLGSSSNAVELVGYFDSPEQALVDTEGHGIPSTHVEAAISGQQMAPFSETSNVGTPGGSRTLYRQAISQNNFSGSRDDVIEIRVARISDLGLQSGTYGGTLRLRMVAN